MATKNKDNAQPATRTETCILPIDIIADTLSRLPVKSIAKFRCVCKEWLSITTDPRFLKSRQERSSSYVIVNEYVAVGEIKLYDFNTLDGKISVRSSYTLNIGRSRLSNFVDGLTCAYDAITADSDTYLLNPTSRELQKLPKTKNKCCHEIFVRAIGLGVDTTSGEYKVFRLLSVSGRNRLQCEIFSVGSKQWRWLGEAPFNKLGDCYNQVLHRGALHLIGYNQKAEKCGLFSFDLKDEKFGSMISIPYPSPSLSCYSYLKESTGKLWLTVKIFSEGCLEIWTIKDYLNDRWVKEYKFDYSRLSSLYNFSYDRYGSHRNLSYDSDIVEGEIILKIRDRQSKWHVTRYDPRNGDFHKLFTAEPSGDFAIYRESLISPKKLLMDGDE